MEQKNQAGLILALDCASRQGSVAVMRDSTVLALSDNNLGNPSRAEELLTIIQTMLAQAKVSVEELSLIAVATGPGSYSGIRIGLATAAGLAKAVNVRWVGVSLLAALALRGSTARFVTALPVGKSDIAWQEFESLDPSSSVGFPRQHSEVAFLDHLGISRPEQIILPSGFKASLLGEEIATVNAGPNLAMLVGEFAVKYPDHTSHTPIYLRNEAYSATGF